MEGRKKRYAILLVVAAVFAAVIAGTAGARTDVRASGTLNIYGYGPGDDVQENRATYATTTPGRRTVFVCGAQFMEMQRRQPGLAADLLIHEELHSLGLGENPPNSSEITARIVARSLITLVKLLARVMIRKSANLTLSVTVRPAAPDRSIRGIRPSSTVSRASANALGSLRSSKKVRSAPTDFNTRLGRTGRSSSPRAAPNR